MWSIIIYFFFIIFSVNANIIYNNYADSLLLPKQCIPTIEMIDASAKLPSGIMSGNIANLGAYDQCLSIKGDIRGKYCVMKVVVEKFDNVSQLPEQRLALQGVDPSDNRTGLILGWCIPEKCQPNELSVNLTIEPLGRLELYPLLDGMCQTEDVLHYKLTASDWGVISFFIIIIVIMILSTLYDVYLHFVKKKPAHLLLIAFSIKTNGEKLVAVSSNPDQLPCLHGIRFISMMWVVLGHRYGSIVAYPVINILTSLKWIENPGNMYLLNAPVSVDSFFVLSGLLLGYGFCLAKSKGVNFNIIIFYLHRYLRLTPLLGILILIHATIFAYFGTGPFWNLGVVYLKNSCTKYWWSALLYIQNYYNPEEICVPQSWYLSVDMQLFILSPIILIPLWKWPKKTLIVSTILVFGSMISSFVISYHFDLVGIPAIENVGVEYSKQYYYATHARYGPWLMGLMLGYYLYTIKKNKQKINMNPFVMLIGWIIALTIMLSTLFAGHVLIKDKDRIANSFFNGMHRHAWSLGLCWVIYACSVGWGGVVNSFLSWSPFQVLGRFTYTVYLVHGTLQTSILIATRTNTYFADFYLMYEFWGDLFFSLAISVCLTLAFESPMITIEKVLFGRNKKDSEKNKQLQKEMQPKIDVESVQEENPKFMEEENYEIPIVHKINEDLNNIGLVNKGFEK